MGDAPTTVEGQSAADIVRGFALNRLDSACLNDPYPTYKALRAHASGQDAEAHAPGVKILCQTCDLVAHPNCAARKLSPLPPAFQATGTTYAHGLDSLQSRHLS